MRQCIKYGEEEIRFRVKYIASRKHKVAIHVCPDGTVEVDAPEEAEPAKIKDAIRARARWISKRLAEIRERNRHILPREYVSGESHFYLGRRYQLKVIVDSGKRRGVKLTGRFLQITSPTNEKASIRQLLKDWYRMRAKEVFASRLTTLVEKISWIDNVPSFRLLSMRVQWGSCSPKGMLILNPALVKAPRDCLDYVILHEMCHLKEHNHSQSYYQLLAELMPDWERQKNRLDSLAEQLLNC